MPIHETALRSKLLLPLALAVLALSGCAVIVADPCADNNGGCDINATCSDNGGVADCICNAGFTGDGAICTPQADPCAANNGGCDPNATCSTDGTSVACTCPAGYTGDGTTCTPVSTAYDPYESCQAGDSCNGGTACVESTLPSGTYNGALCSNSCTSPTDCLGVPNGYAPACVNGLCYLTCPSSDACPYGQSCLQFQDQSGNLIQLCTP